jgi:ABC-2 type transport system permease protein
MRPLWVLLRHGYWQLLGGPRLLISALGVGLTVLPVALIFGAVSDDGVAEYLGLARVLILPIIVPIICFVFATAAAGNEARDGTMVNLVTKPYPRELVIAAKYLAAVTASLTLLLPVELIGHLLAAQGISGGGVLGGILLSTVLGTLAYAALGLLLGLLMSRALLVGLAYSLLWEGTIAGVAPSAATLSIRGYTEGMLSAAAEPDGLGFATRLGPVTSLTAALVVAAIAFLLAARRLRRMDLR